MLGSKEAKDTDTFFIRGRHQNLDFFCISQSLYELPKNTIRNLCSKIILFPQTFKDITMIYNNIPGLQMSFSKSRDFCRDSWKEKYNSIQIDEDKDLKEMYNIKNLPVLEITAVPETTAFYVIFVLG